MVHQLQSDSVQTVITIQYQLGNLHIEDKHETTVQMPVPGLENTDSGKSPRIQTIILFR